MYFGCTPFHIYTCSRGCRHSLAAGGGVPLARLGLVLGNLLPQSVTPLSPFCCCGCGRLLAAGASSASLCSLLAGRPQLCSTLSAVSISHTTWPPCAPASMYLRNRSVHPTCQLYHVDDAALHAARMARTWSSHGERRCHQGWSRLLHRQLSTLPKPPGRMLTLCMCTASSHIAGCAAGPCMLSLRHDNACLKA
jgi:hypothetical protein